MWSIKDIAKAAGTTRQHAIDAARDLGLSVYVADNHGRVEFILEADRNTRRALINHLAGA